MRSELPELLRQPSFHVINLLEILGHDQSGAKHLQTVTPTASGDPSKAPAPDKSMVYLESLEEIASITNPHVVDAADMLLQRFYAPVVSIPKRTRV
ncbi:MAG: hypothetical protein COV46_00595 [Deltaproteobacteria bacterium CG11_big_fil_rev_8_21_14_0_20_49_13]|nr:MAG: hypothetical protein COV46_00595 [Deltaproteobacteria bacterium CG11_big_fil_rev_8_21_14_0_20_49_13]